MPAAARATDLCHHAFAREDPTRAAQPGEDAERSVTGGILSQTSSYSSNDSPALVILSHLPVKQLGLIVLADSLFSTASLFFAYFEAKADGLNNEKKDAFSESSYGSFNLEV